MTRRAQPLRPPGRRDSTIERAAHSIIEGVSDSFGVWIPLASATTFCFTAISGTAARDPNLPWLAKTGLLGAELLTLLVVCGLPLVALRSVRGRAMNGRSLQRALEVVVLGGLSLFIALGWATFYSVGSFINLSLMRLAWASPVELLRHALHSQPIGTMLFACAPFALAWASLRSLGWVRRKPYPTRSVLVLVGLIAACMLGAAQFFGFYSTRPDLYEARAAHSSGPAVHLISDLRYRVRIGTDEFALQSSVVAPSVRRDVEPETSVSPAKKWNVALIVVESLRNDQLVTFGGKRTVMEVVDELAQRSSRFINHRTQASHSDYADIAILSSHFPLRDPIYHIYPEDPAYPRIRVYDALKDAGYHVGIFSSQNESWGGMINYLESPSIDRLVHSENYDGPTYVPRGDAGFARFVKGSKRSGKIDDRYTIDEAISWTRSLPDGPFFFYMNLQNSHFPYERPADFPPKFGSGSVDFPIRFNDFPADSADAVIDLYSNALAYVDSQIDRLLKALQASGQLDSTVIIVTGDTGQAFYEHGFAAHGGPLFDEVMKVPLIISTPGGGPVEDNRPSQHIDIAPTILSLLGLPPHPGHQGRSLAGETWGGERSLFLLSQASAHQYAVVQHGFKLIYDAERQAYLLFDLMRDPAERFDLASAQRAQVESMAVLLHTWRRSQLAYYADPRLHQDWYPPLLDPASVGDR